MSLDTPPHHPTPPTILFNTIVPTALDFRRRIATHQDHVSASAFFSVVFFPAALAFDLGIGSERRRKVEGKQQQSNVGRIITIYGCLVAKLAQFHHPSLIFQLVLNYIMGLPF